MGSDLSVFLQEYLTHEEFPEKLKRKVISKFSKHAKKDKELWDKLQGGEEADKARNEAKILEALPEKVRHQAYDHLFGKFFNSMPIMKTIRDSASVSSSGFARFKHKICDKLERHFVSNKTIVDDSTEPLIVFIRHHYVKLQDNGIPSGQFFRGTIMTLSMPVDGMLSMFPASGAGVTYKRQGMTVTTQSNCEYSSITLKEWDSLLAGFPDIQRIYINYRDEEKRRLEEEAARLVAAEAQQAERQAREKQRLLDQRLYHAAEAGDVGKVKELQTAGANINCQVGKLMESPLHRCCISMRLPTLALLLELGADAQLVNRDLYTPLHTACQEGWAEGVQFLMKHSADPHMQTINGDTSAHIAARGGQSDVCTALMNGAYERDIFIDLIGQNGDRQTPLDLCKTHELRRILKPKSDFGNAFERR